MNNKLHLLKGLDRILGTLLVHALNLILRPKNNNIYNISSVLIIRPGGIGDAVLLLPAIQSLKERFPDSEIDILCEKRNAEAFALSYKINRIYLYDRGLELFKCLKNKYDIVIDTEQWHRLSAVVAYLTSAPVRIGFNTNERAKLFTHKIYYSHEDYEVDSFLRLLSPISDKITFNASEPFLTVPSESSEKVKPLLSALTDRKIIAIFPGGSITERHWGAERFYELAVLLSTHGYSIAVVGGKEDTLQGEKIIDRIPYSLNLCGKLSLSETAAVLKKSTLLITGDSGIMHIAYGLGIKTLSLFGPGIEKKWAPIGERHIVINKHLSCSPCTKFGYTPKCKKGIECLKHITPEEVFKEAVRLILKD